MRANDPGAGYTIPEERFNPRPFYFTSLSPPTYRWDELNMTAEAAQRWFYSNFTGRTQRSIWRSETAYQTDAQRVASGDYTNPLMWTMPNFVNNVAAGAGYLNEPYMFANYLDLGNNQRPANTITGRAADAATVIDEHYIAPRHTFKRLEMSFAMYMPSAAQIAAVGSTVADDTLFAIGAEVNSKGVHSAYIGLIGDGAGGLVWHMQLGGVNSEGTNDGPANVITINNPGAWAWYHMSIDPPVFRFIQPIFGQTRYWLPGNEDVEELSLPRMSAGQMWQPFVCNESVAARNNVLTWRLGSWAIWPAEHLGNVYKYSVRNCTTCGCNMSTPCGCYGVCYFEPIFDTGARPFLHINIKTIGCGCSYVIEHCETGKDQNAGAPERRVWRRIDDSDYAGVTATPSGEAGIGLFNAARFIRVRLANAYPVVTDGKTEEVNFTANSGST